MRLMADYLKEREPHQDDNDVIDGMFMSLNTAGLVVVSKVEWKARNALKAFLKMVALVDTDDLPADLKEAMQRGLRD